MNKANKTSIKKKTRNLKVYCFFSRYKTLPYIRLTGVWLQKAGFEIGQNICVKVKNKQLIITAKDKE